MAIQRIGGIDVNGVAQYQASTTDLEEDYPTIDDCAAGSSMTIINEVTKKITGFKEFNGTIWADL